MSKRECDVLGQDLSFITCQQAEDPTLSSAKRPKYRCNSVDEPVFKTSIDGGDPATSRRVQDLTAAASPSIQPAGQNTDENQKAYSVMKIPDDADNMDVEEEFADYCFYLEDQNQNLPAKQNWAMIRKQSPKRQTVFSARKEVWNALRRSPNE